MQQNSDLQSTITVKTTLVLRKLLVELSIPIVTKTPYKLTKITTVPITVHDQTIFIDVENKQYLVNEEQNEYIPISELELSKCIKLQKNRLICSPQTQSYIKNTEVCESKLIFGSEINNILRKCN